MRNPKNPIAVALFAIMLAALFGGAAVVFLLRSAGTRALAESVGLIAPPKAPLTDDGAREVAKFAIGELLGQKTKATFPALRDMKVIRRGDRALVRSHVDARDRFGRERRLDFLVEFKPSPQGDFWALENWRLGTRSGRR